MQELRTPNKEEIKSMMNEVHNVWLKKYWDAKTDEEFINMVKEAQVIRDKYPFHVTEVLTLEFACIIDEHAKEQLERNE